MCCQLCPSGSAPPTKTIPFCPVLLVPQVGLWRTFAPTHKKKVLIALFFYNPKLLRRALREERRRRAAEAAGAALVGPMGGVGSIGRANGRVSGGGGVGALFRDVSASSVVFEHKRRRRQSSWKNVGKEAGIVRPVLAPEPHLSAVLAHAVLAHEPMNRNRPPTGFAPLAAAQVQSLSGDDSLPAAGVVVQHLHRSPDVYLGARPSPGGAVGRAPPLLPTSAETKDENLSANGLNEKAPANAGLDETAQQHPMTMSAQSPPLSTITTTVAQDISTVVDLAVKDSDEWVRSIGRLLEKFPLLSVDSELVYKVNADLEKLFTLKAGDDFRVNDDDVDPLSDEEREYVV